MSREEERPLRMADSPSEASSLLPLNIDAPVDDESSNNSTTRRSRRVAAITGVALSLAGVAGVVSTRTQTFSTASPLSSSSPSSASAAAAALDLFAVDKSVKRMERPHIILFTIDDMGWNDVGYESSDIPHATPFMNKMVEKSVKLTHYYTQPSCTPSRATMMTGRYAHYLGFQNYELSPDDYLGLPLSFKLMPSFMRDAGYKTYGLGKWNIGFCNVKYMPQERGFDTFLGYNCPGHGYSDHTCTPRFVSYDMMDMFEGWSKETDEGRVGHWETGVQYKGTYDTLLYRDRAHKSIVEHAADFGAENAEKPMFMWSAQHGMHAELDSGPEPPEDLLTSENEEYIAALRESSTDMSDGTEQHFVLKRIVTATVMMSIDNSLRHLVHTLKQAGMYENTVLFVHADNGGHPGYSTGFPGNNYPLRGEKFTYFQGGVNVPAYVHSPWFSNWDNIRGQEWHGMMHHVDLATTFAGMAGWDVAALKKAHSLDGYDMTEAIENLRSKEESPRSDLVLTLPRDTTWEYRDPAHLGEWGYAAVMVGERYKIMIGHAADGWYSPEKGSKYYRHPVSFFENEQNDYFYPDTYNYTNWLFDLESDPHEKMNLWNSESEHIKQVKANMLAKLEGMASEAGEYGKVIWDVYEKFSNLNGTLNGTLNDHTEMYKVWVENGNYITPYGCAPIE